MNDKLDQFTTQAKDVLKAAQREAIRLGHEFIAPEHLLLALIKIDPVAAQERLGLPASVVILGIGRVVTPGKAPVQQKPILNAEVKQAITQAVQEAMQLGHDYFDCDHLLLGIVRNEQSLATKTLSELGISPRMIVEKIYQCMITSAFKVIHQLKAEQEKQKASESS